MSWQVRARVAAQRLGLDPRYVRRLRWIHKARAVRRVGGSMGHNLQFIVLDPEPDNFTYELDNEPDLLQWTATVACTARSEAGRRLGEPRSDAVLAARLRQATAARWLWTKAAPPFGKRAAWYALARILRPEVIIETGVHDGLGSLLLLRALERNADEGRAGRLVSFDINPTAGWIVGTHPLWELHIESSRTGLPAALARHRQVGMFVHDSLHTYENERWELRTAAQRLAPGGVLITDNAHVTRALEDTCREFDLRYAEFHERPLGHFYPGGALGAGRKDAPTPDRVDAQ